MLPADPAEAAAPGPGAGRLAAVGALSAGVLAFEVLLLRLFEFSHWHHFAGLAVSLALLGFGAAGTTLTLLGPRATGWGDRLLVASLAATAAGLLLVLAVQTRFTLRPLVAGWDPAALGRLLLVDLVAFLPFYAAGLGIGQAFARWPGRARTVYAANLLGSGLGSLAATLALAVLQVEAAVALVAALLAGCGALLALGQRRRRSGALCLGVAALAGVAVAVPLSPAVSDFKALARLQDLPDARTLSVEPGLPGRLSLIRSQSLRMAPGLSLAWPEAVAPVDAAVLGSDRVVPLPRGYPYRPAHAEASLPGLPHRLRPDAAVLVLGSGRWQAGMAAGPGLTWVEPDHRLLEWAGRRGAVGAGVEAVADAPYRHLTVTPQRYGIIVVAPAFDGGDAASEDYLLTGAGLARALARLRPDGLLALPLELHHPPRHLPRLLATVRDALERSGASRPGDHVAVLRGLQALLVLAGREPMSTPDLQSLRGFAARWDFDLVWLPDLRPDEVNRHHRLESPLFFQSARAVLGDGRLPDAARWFATEPATLDRPYFWRSLVWQRVPEFMDSLGRRAPSYLDWTLLLTAASACAVTLLGLALILLPLGRLPRAPRPFSRPAVAAYFTALGLGYLLLELALFQRAVLFLGEPVLAASLVFAVFLVGSGAGSATAPTAAGRRSVAAIWAGVAAGLGIAMAGLWGFADALLQLPLGGRGAALAATLLPLAWALGRPFPWALHQLAGRPRWIPWAWGINGFASVAAAALATLISVQWGQSATVATGTACYLAALAVALVWTRAKPGKPGTPHLRED